MSLKTYPYKRGYNGPLILNIDLREDPPIIKEVTEPIPHNIRVAKHKKQAQYKFDVMNGQAHPILLDVEDYALVTVHHCSLRQETFQNVSQGENFYGFNEEEISFIQSVQQQPEVEWAIDNSFDGIYVNKTDDHARMAIDFRFAVYLKAEQATFWKLKFHGK